MKLFIALLSFSLSSYVIPNSVKVTEVFICVSSSSKVYHSKKDCRGLNACTHTIKKVTVKEAINDYGRRACKVCY